MALSVACGLRRSEIASLKFSNVNLINKIITVIGKGNKERFVAPNPQAWEKFHAWLVVRGTDGCSSLFVAVKKGNNVQVNRPMTANAIYQILRSVPKKLALMRFLRMIFAELLPHDFLSTVPISTLSGPMTANAIYQILRSVPKKLALMRFLRMIFAELLPHDFLSTVPISTLSVKQLGHASVLTKQKYDKRDQSVVSEAIRDVYL